ncbi:hypothetical protein ACO0LF_19360 [Undibacterium sp. Di27W]|uniref:hypothetical protein n=1 Tax=Undibacterium sp. Di27W TaxID=3413036 RepID=UPI003BF3AE95
MSNLLGSKQAPAGIGLLSQRQKNAMHDSIPPHVMRVIKQMKNASDEEKAIFFKKISQAIQNAPDKTPEDKQAVMKKFMRAMSV